MKIRFHAAKYKRNINGRTTHLTRDFPEQTKRVLRGFAASSDRAFIDVMGAPAPILDVHAMTPQEVRRDEAIGGGDGYMHLSSDGRIRVAIRPDVDPMRATEVWTEEQVHALDPSLSENEVRGTYVPAIVRRVLRG